ncbi:glycosylphosphatidylinositol anchor attachment 1 protein [Clonorchis sinensis]|uniref:Glycosylphosphatidylinositol anchor attachment 1 protein n=1 Tax=Clonorchis sinensis TaxID=79923 RepID=G7YME9_CLOSI|nr:glycosylphosphatidylinositol anchor attachment 1 protein [Clonorchis sinensis]
MHIICHNKIQLCGTYSTETVDTSGDSCLYPELRGSCQIHRPQTTAPHTMAFRISEGPCRIALDNRRFAYCFLISKHAQLTSFFGFPDFSLALEVACCICITPICNAQKRWCFDYWMNAQYYIVPLHFPANACAATSGTIVQQVQSRMWAKNFEMRLIKTNRKIMTANEGCFSSERICKEMQDFDVEIFVSLARVLHKDALCIQGAARKLCEWHKTFYPEIRTLLRTRRNFRSFSFIVRILNDLLKPRGLGQMVSFPGSRKARVLVQDDIHGIQSTDVLNWIPFAQHYVQRTNILTGILKEKRISVSKTKKQGTLWRQINKNHKPELGSVKNRGHVGIDEPGHRITEQPMEPPDRTTNRDQRSPRARSTYINTHAILLNAQPPTHLYAPLRHFDWRLNVCNEIAQLSEQANDQSTCVLITGLHGLLINYQIPAVTLRGPSCKHRSLSSSRKSPRLGKFVEGILRSLNNLQERLHQSFWYYLLPNPMRYISIGVYIPPVLILIGSLLIKLLHYERRCHLTLTNMFGNAVNYLVNQVHLPLRRHRRQVEIRKDEDGIPPTLARLAIWTVTSFAFGLFLHVSPKVIFLLYEHPKWDGIQHFWGIQPLVGDFLAFTVLCLFGVVAFATPLIITIIYRSVASSNTAATMAVCKNSKKSLSWHSVTLEGFKNHYIDIQQYPPRLQIVIPKIQPTLGQLTPEVANLRTCGADVTSVCLTRSEFTLRLWPLRAEDIRKVSALTIGVHEALVSPVLSGSNREVDSVVWQRTLTSKPSRVDNCRLRGWGPWDSTHQWLMTLEEMARSHSCTGLVTCSGYQLTDLLKEAFSHNHTKGRNEPDELEQLYGKYAQRKWNRVLNKVKSQTSSYVRKITRKLGLSVQNLRATQNRAFMTCQRTLIRLVVDYTTTSTYGLEKFLNQIIQTLQKDTTRNFEDSFDLVNEFRQETVYLNEKLSFDASSPYTSIPTT